MWEKQDLAAAGGKVGSGGLGTGTESREPVSSTLSVNPLLELRQCGGGSHLTQMQRGQKPTGSGREKDGLGKETGSRSKGAGKTDLMRT